MGVADYKMRMREEAKRQLKGRGNDAPSYRRHRQNIEDGRKQLLIKSAEGGDRAAKAIKSELEYLLRNYLPTYDYRIQMLIDKWRTSGDPEYNPEIRARYRRVQADYGKNSRAF